MLALEYDASLASWPTRPADDIQLPPELQDLQPITANGIFDLTALHRSVPGGLPC